MDSVRHRAKLHRDNSLKVDWEKLSARRQILIGRSRLCDANQTDYMEIADCRRNRAHYWFQAGFDVLRDNSPNFPFRHTVCRHKKVKSRPSRLCRRRASSGSYGVGRGSGGGCRVNLRSRARHHEDSGIRYDKRLLPSHLRLPRQGGSDEYHPFSRRKTWRLLDNSAFIRSCYHDRCLQCLYSSPTTRDLS